MIMRRLLALLVFWVGIVPAFLDVMTSRTVRAQEAPSPPSVVPGRFFSITEPITKETIERVEDGAKQLIRSNATPESRPVLVFEIRPGQTSRRGQ